MGFLPHEIEWEVDKWIDRFMKGETDDSLYSFIKETNVRLIERASWNDDEDVNVLKDVNIRDVYYEHINDKGVITSMVDVYDEEDALYGNITELESYFNDVRNKLWEKGILQKVYDENQNYGEDEIYCFIAENHKKWK